ncbi:hypothetical protein GCM10009827_077780 [Dactylosporangium maewongense]|uniref:Uncharacterized protein n=1 Tax=Dactylosporangium maewongense TaxID=634393 RepID=A0ABP4MK37_9ACTN
MKSVTGALTLNRGVGEMSQNTALVEPARELSAAVAKHAAEKVTHRRCEPPDEHRCTCGHPRERCVTETIRALWHMPV